MRLPRFFALIFAVATTAGCGTSGSPPERQREAPPAEPVATGPAPSRPRIVALGDSLTVGLGLAPDEAYPNLLQRRLDEAKLDFEIVNAGVSGDTSAGGLSRLEWALDGDVRVLIVALGGNDGLRGLPPDELRRNLAAIIETTQARGVDVILAGMEAPPNFGPAYTAAFREVYRELAGTFGVPLVPFLLEGVAGESALNQRDGIHPTAEGARIVADTVWTVLQPIAVEHASRPLRRPVSSGS